MKDAKRNKINLIFSSFLVIGYIICTFFFSTLATQVGGFVGDLIQVLIFVLFGLLLFYATRVGEGVQVKRFSLAVLLLVDLPALYIIVATYTTGLPFHEQLATAASLPVVFILACIALGYGIPYTFISGYEIEQEIEEETAEDDAVLEGGLAQELAAADEEEEAFADVAEDESPDSAEEAAEPAADETPAESADETPAEE